MHLEILTDSQKLVLERLAAVPAIGTFYLAGGTALALQIGHRRSIDFDFFTPDEFDADAIVGDLRQTPADVRVRRRAVNTVLLLLDGVTTSFFRSRYPLIRPALPTRWGFPLASPEDIAAMKLEAIGSRGSRKDFVDMFFLCRSIPLDEVFRLFAAKYAGEAYDPYHRLRSLAYFDDAERQPMPEMIEAVEWADIRRTFEEQVRTLWDAADRLP